MKELASGVLPTSSPLSPPGQRLIAGRHREKTRTQATHATYVRRRPTFAFISRLWSIKAGSQGHLVLIGARDLTTSCLQIVDEGQDRNPGSCEHGSFAKDIGITRSLQGNSDVRIK